MRLPNERDIRLLIDTRAAERNAVTEVNQDYGMNEADRFVLADATAAALTVTLPSAIGLRGLGAFTVKRINGGGNAVTVEGSGSETIDGAANVSLSSQWDRITVISDNANWLRI
jgi:hypothetical protein